MAFFDFLFKDDEEEYKGYKLSSDVDTALQKQLIDRGRGNEINSLTPDAIKKANSQMNVTANSTPAIISTGKNSLAPEPVKAKDVANDVIGKTVVPAAEWLNVVDDAGSGEDNKYLKRDDGSPVLLQDLPAVQQAAGAAFHSFKAVGRGVLGTVEGGLRGLEWLGADSAKPFADKVTEWQRATALDTRGMGQGQMFLENLTSGIGSAAMFYVPGAGIAKGLGAMNAVRFFGSYTPKIAMLFGGAVSTALEAMTEAGSSYQDALDNGDDKELADAKAASVFWANSALIFLTNYLGRFSPETRSQLKSMLMSAPTEGIQEYGQQVISNIAANRDWKEGAAESGLIGGIIGGLLGADNLNVNEISGQEAKTAQVIKTDAVSKRLQDVAMKASIILKGKPGAETQVGNDILKLQENSLKNTENVGQFYREVAGVIKNSTLSEADKARLLSMDEGLAGTVKDFNTETKNDPSLFESLAKQSLTNFSPEEQKAAINNISSKLKISYSEAAKTFNILRELASGSSSEEKRPDIFEDAVNQAKLESGQTPDIISEAVNQASRDVVVPADMVQDEPIDVYHLTNEDTEAIKDGGFNFGKNSVFGEAAFFSSTPDATYGNNSIKINTSGLNLKAINSIQEQQAYVASQNAANVADAIRKEGKYDGFTIEQPGGNKVVAVTNKEKLDSILKKQQFITTEEAKKMSKEFAFIEALDIPVIMKKQILTQSGQEAFGRYSRPIIEFLDNPHKTTIPHEAVHAYIDLMLTPKQKQALLSEVKRRYAGKKYSDIEAEERLAQDFAKYYTQKKDGQAAQAPSSTIKKFFDKFIELLQRVFAPGNVDKIQKFYQDVETKKPGLLKRRYVNRKIARGFEARRALQQEYFMEPNKLTTKFLENVDVKNRETASYPFLANLLKSKSLPLKEAERDLISDVLETQFKDEKKINMDDFRNAIVSELVPLKIIESGTYSDYGAYEIGRGEGENGTHDYTTLIFNSPFDHGYTGHFSGDFSTSLTRDNLEIKQIPGQKKWAVVNKGQELTEENIAQNVYHVTDSEKKAEAWIQDRIKADYYGKGTRQYVIGQEMVDVGKRGLFSHARVWEPDAQYIENTDEDPDVLYVAEIQSDAFQNIEKVVDRPEKYFEYYKNLDQAKKDWDKKEIFIVNDEGDDYAAEEWSEIVSAFENGQKVGYEKTKDTSPEETAFLQYRNTWHERTIRELIRIAAMRGKKRLRFPTPYTISKIEGYLNEGGQIPEDTNRGDTFDYGGDDYVLLDTVGEEDRAGKVAPYKDVRGIWDFDTVRQEDVNNQIDEITYELRNTKDLGQAVDDDFILSRYLSNEERDEIKNGGVEGPKFDELIEKAAEAEINSRYTDASEYATYYNDEVYGEENSFATDDDRIIILEDNRNVETFSFGSPEMEKENFDYTKLDVQEQRTVNEFYDKKIGRYLTKLKKENSRIVTDHLGYDWLEIDVTPEDKEAVEAFQTKDSLKMNKPKVVSGDEVAQYLSDIEQEKDEGWEQDEYLLDIIKSQNFAMTKINIKDLLKTDPDLKAYVDNGENRYPEGADGLDNPIIVGYWEPTRPRQVLDGYNRVLTMVQNGQSIADAYVAIEPSMRELHPEDKRTMTSFIDYVRLRKPENVQLEIDARRTAEGYGITPDKTNIRLANAFDKLLQLQPKYQLDTEKENKFFSIWKDLVAQSYAQDENEDDDIDLTDIEASAWSAAKKAGFEMEYNDSFQTYEISIPNSTKDIYEAQRKIVDAAKFFGFELEANPDGTIKMYHGTSLGNGMAIMNAGFDDGSFFSPSTEYEYGGVNGAGYYGDNILSADIDPRSLVFRSEGEYYIEDGSAAENIRVVYSKEGIKYQTAEDIVKKSTVRGNKNVKNVIGKASGLVKENEIISATEKSLLKHKLRNIQRGITIGRSDMRAVMIEAFRKKIKDQDLIKKSIIAYAGDLPDNDRGRLLPMVAKATTQRDLAKAFIRIDAALQNADKKEQLQEFKDIVDQTKRAIKSGAGIAVDYQKKLMDVISDYNFSRPTDKTFKKLIALREYLKAHEGAIVPGHILKQLDKLTRVNIKDLDANTIKNINDLLSRMLALGHLKLQMKNSYDERQRQVSLAKLIESTVSLDPSGDPRDQSFSLKASGVRSKLNLLHAFRVTDKLDGNADYRGQNTRLQQKVAQKVSNAELTANATLRAVLGQIREVKDEWTEDEQAIMELHLLIQQGAQEQAQQLISKVGWKELPKLTAEMEMAMDIMRGAFAKTEDYLAAVYEEMENKPFDKVQNYFPLKYEKKVGEIPEPTVGQKFPRTTKTEQGFTFKRLPNVKRVPRVDVFAQFEEAVREQQYYMQVQPALMEIRSLINDPAYRDKAGQVAINWWRDYMDGVANKGALSRAEHHALLAKARVNLSRAILGYKLSSIVIQPMAVFDAMAYAQARFGSIAAGKILAHFAGSWIRPGYAKKIKQLSPAIQLRDGGELAIEEIEAMTKGKGGVINAFTKGSMALLKWADIKTAAAVDQAFYHILRKEGLSDAEARREADLLMNIVSGSSEIADRPLVLMKGEIFKTLFTFQTFLLNRWGLISHDLISSGLIKGKMDRKAKALLGLIILAIGSASEDKISQWLSELVSGKKIKNKLEFWQSALMAIPESVPVLGQMINGAINYNQSFSIPITRVFDNIITGTKQLTSDKEETRIKGAMKLSENLAALLGIPGTAQAFDIADRLISAPQPRARAVPNGIFSDPALPALPGLPDLPALPSL